MVGWQVIFFFSVTLILFFFFVVVSVVLPFSGINKQNHALSVFIPYMDWIYQIRAYRDK